MCSSSPGFEPGPPEELDLYLPKSLIFRSLHSVLRSHAEGHRFEPGRYRIDKNAFDFILGRVPKLQRVFTTLGQYGTSFLSLRTWGTLPKMELLKDECFLSAAKRGALRKTE